MPPTVPQDDATIRRDVRTAIQRNLGALPPWIDEVLKRLTFKLDQSAGVPTYSGGTIRGDASNVYDAGQINIARLPQLVHELWHAYLDLIARGGSSPFARDVRAQFEKTRQRQDSYRGLQRDGDDFVYFAHDVLRRGGMLNWVIQPYRFWTYHSGAEAQDMADELWGNYIQNVLDRVTDIARRARFGAEAQLLWDTWRRSNDSALQLPSDYTEQLKKLYALGGDVGSFIRNKLLGLDDKVDRWPQAYRLWERNLSTRQGTLIADALERANAHRDGDSRGVLERFLRAWMPRDPAIGPVYVKLGSPQITVRSTTNAADLGVRDLGGYHLVLVCPAAWAVRESGDVPSTRINFATLGNELPRLLAPPAPRR